MKILIIDDHPKLRENLRKICELERFTAETAIHGADGLEKVKNAQYDCIILDMNMPIMNGKDFLLELRKLDASIPVLVLTSNSLLSDKIEAFDIGADDYLTKPFEMEELIARIKALVRRKNTAILETLDIGNITVDLTHGKVTKDSKEIDLSAKEYKIIAYLSENRSMSKTKDDILQAVWGEREESLPLGSTTLEAHISSVRKKLGKDFIKTNRNVGYVVE